MAPTSSQPPDDIGPIVTFVCNNKFPLRANRSSVINSSCFYLNRLLAGPFRESRQNKIYIELHGRISVKVYEHVLKYAESGSFDPSMSDLEIYTDMLQLATLWIYDDLVDFLEEFLKNKINRHTVCLFHAISNKFKLEGLLQKCIQYEDFMETGGVPSIIGWFRCPLPGHEKHSYMSCKRKKNCLRASPRRVYNEDLGFWQDQVEWLIDENFHESDYEWSESDEEIKKPTATVNLVLPRRTRNRRILCYK